MIKKPTPYVGMMMIIFLLTACHEKPSISEIEAKIEAKSEQKKPDQSSPTDALKALDQTLSVGNKITNAKDIKFDTDAYAHDLPETMKQACHFDNKKTDKETGEVIDFCTEIDIYLAKIEPKWIEQVVNKSITDDDGAKLMKFKQTLDEFVDEHLMYIKELQEDAKENNEEFTQAPMYAWSKKPELLPTFNNLAQVVVYSDIYMGGAHGMQNAEYLIFDMDLESQIRLHDVVKKNKESEFFELAHKAFKHYLKTELELKSAREIKEYEETWAFALPENFYFGDSGLKLIYQPYEMGAYAQGFIELTLPYDGQLSDMVKQQYLPVGQTSINP